MCVCMYECMFVCIYFHVYSHVCIPIWNQTASFANGRVMLHAAWKLMIGWQTIKLFIYTLIIFHPFPFSRYFLAEREAGREIPMSKIPKTALDQIKGKYYVSEVV